MTPWTAISGIPRSFNSLKGNLRSFIRPDHILLRIDAEFDFAGLVAPLKRSIALTMGALPSTQKQWCWLCFSLPSTIFSPSASCAMPSPRTSLFAGSSL